MRSIDGRLRRCYGTESFFSGRTRMVRRILVDGTLAKEAEGLPIASGP